MSEHSKWLGTSALFIFVKWLNCFLFFMLTVACVTPQMFSRLYDTLQIVFIASTFIQLSTHSPFFPQECIKITAQLRKRVDLWLSVVFYCWEQLTECWMAERKGNRRCAGLCLWGCFDCYIKPPFGKVTISFSRVAKVHQYSYCGC